MVSVRFEWLYLFVFFFLSFQPHSGWSCREVSELTPQSSCRALAALLRKPRQPAALDQSSSVLHAPCHAMRLETDDGVSEDASHPSRASPRLDGAMVSTSATDPAQLLQLRVCGSGRRAVVESQECAGAPRPTTHSVDKVIQYRQAMLRGR